MMYTPKDTDEFVAISRVLSEIRDRLHELVQAEAAVQAAYGDATEREYQDMRMEDHHRYGRVDGLLAADHLLSMAQAGLYGALQQSRSR